MKLIFDLAGEAAADRAAELGQGRGCGGGRGRVGDPGDVGVPRVPEVPRSTGWDCVYVRHRGLPLHSQGAAGAFLPNKLYAYTLHVLSGEITIHT